MSAITANTPIHDAPPTRADYARIAGRILHLTEKLTQLVDRWVALNQPPAPTGPTSPPGSVEPPPLNATNPTDLATTPTAVTRSPAAIPSAPVHDGPTRPSNPPLLPAPPAPPSTPDLTQLTTVSTILKRITEIVHLVFKLQPPELDDLDHFPYSDPVALREVFGDEEV